MATTPTAVQLIISTINKFPELATKEWILKQCEEAKVHERKQLFDAYYAGTAQFDNAAAIVYPKTPKEYCDETYGECDIDYPINQFRP